MEKTVPLAPAEVNTKQQASPNLQEKAAGLEAKVKMINIRRRDLVPQDEWTSDDYGRGGRQQPYVYQTNAQRYPSYSTYEESDEDESDEDESDESDESESIDHYSTNQYHKRQPVRYHDNPWSNIRVPGYFVARTRKFGREKHATTGPLAIEDHTRQLPDGAMVKPNFCKPLHPSFKPGKPGRGAESMYSAARPKKPVQRHRKGRQ
jgi:hypothetical protein